MNLFVKVVPGAKQIRVEKTLTGLKVHLTEPAKDGKANAQLLRILSDHFLINQSKIKIISGKTSRVKIISLL